MKQFIFFIFIGIAFSNSNLNAAKTISPVRTKTNAPWLELRKSPLFNSATQSLAKTWGPSIPIGNEFIIEKRYGRWLFGKPSPLKNMKKKDFSPSGWVYSRMLIMHDDHSTRSRFQDEQIFYTSYYGKIYRKKIGLTEKSKSFFDFLENLVLSEKTLSLFQNQDERAMAKIWTGPFPSAQAKEEALPNVDVEKPLGLAGTDLEFLHEEIQQKAEKRAEEAARIKAAQLNAPNLHSINSSIRKRIFSQLVADQITQIPALSQEEVDGNMYLKALVTRSLNACNEKIQKYWKTRAWFVFRTLNDKSYALPGGYFSVGNRVARLSANEAEFAFSVLRPLVAEARLGEYKVDFKVDWVKKINKKKDDFIESIAKPSTDIADDIEIDLATASCIGGAGYKPEAGINYLKKSLAGEQQSVPYRIERFNTLLPEAIGNGAIKSGAILNTKRYFQVKKLWNIP